MKIDRQFYETLLDNLKNPIAFVDTNHVIRYMNKAALSHYEEGRSLIGESIFACHNTESCDLIRQIFSDMLTGLEEQMITDNEKYRIFMRAVRDRSGDLIGYHERYEPPRKLAPIGPDSQ
jgi:DUF438 domain-containing protein